MVDDTVSLGDPESAEEVEVITQEVDQPTNKTAPKAAYTEKEVKKEQPIAVASKRPKSLQAYVGAELYNKRMFPTGCPSYQKAFVKLFKIEKSPKGGRRMKLVDTNFFNNRDGFGYVMRNLTKGEYQIQFKKYSTGFDVFDFTVRIYSSEQIKLIDNEQEEIKKIKLT